MQVYSVGKVFNTHDRNVWVDLKLLFYVLPNISKTIETL